MKTKFIAMLLLIMAISVGMATAYMGSGMGNNRYGGMHSHNNGYGSNGMGSNAYGSMHGYGYSNNMDNGHNSMHSGYGRYGDQHNSMHGYDYNNYGNQYGSRYSDDDRPGTSRYNQRTRRSNRWWNWN